MEVYESPSLVVLGSVDQLTAGVGAGAAPDGQGSVEIKQPDAGGL